MQAKDKEGRKFAFVQERFPQISMEKLVANVFDGPQIRELMKYPVFDEVLCKAELSSWQPESVFTNFPGKHRRAQDMREIQELLKTFR